MKEDKQLIVITHLSQLLSFLTGFGGLIVPLVIWMSKKDEIYEMDEQGKAIVNFQISIMIYAFACIPMIFLCGFGILGLIVVGIISFIFPIVNAIKANNGERINYPLSIQFIK